MKLKTTLIAATLLLSITSAQAELVNTDWKVAGDARATLHQESGIEWLKLNNTKGKSIGAITSLLSTTYQGWRLPTHEEVGNLMDFHFTLLDLTDDSMIVADSVENRAQGVSWVEKMSDTWISSNYVYSRGLHVSTSGNTVASGAYSYTTMHQGRVFSGFHLGNGLNFSIGDAGVFLVSDGGTTLSSQLDPTINANNVNNAPAVDVPAPTIMGGLLALFGLASLRRRSSTTIF